MIMRWLCNKCNRKWTHPLSKCLYCKSEITKQRGTAFLVKGVTKVNVPSPFHPLVPYYVLLLEDEFGNRTPKKSMKIYSLGDKFVIPKAKSQDAVSAVKVKYDVHHALRDAIELLDSFPFSEKDSVLIKVEAGEKVAPQQGSTTSPQVLEALVDLLQEKKVQNIVVVDRSKKDLFLSSKKNGILKVCKKKGVSLINLSDDEYVEKENFLIPKVLEGRKVIIASPLRTDSPLSVGGTLQSLVSLCHPETQKKIQENPRIHLTRFLEVLTPSLAIGDGTVGLERDMHLSGNKPVFLHTLLASKNCASLDSIFAQLGMLESPSYIASLAGKQEVVGEELEVMKRKLA